jgi:hypothetical protein
MSPAPREEAPPLFRHLPAEGFILVRERAFPYALLALACALTALAVYSKVDLIRVFASGDTVATMRTPPINVILMTSLIAIFFVLPSALRRIEPNFRMTMWRATITGVILFFVGAATEVGYAAAIIPGIVVGVLLSQTLINALLSSDQRATPRQAAATIVNSARGSFKLTREHFATTFCILAISIAMLGFPFLVGLIVLVVADALNPLSLVATAPALFLTFIYCECMRYVLIVRWYRRLEIAERAKNDPNADAARGDAAVHAAPDTRRIA